MSDRHEINGTALQFVGRDGRVDPSTVTILVVEDDDDVRELAAETLAEEGYRVHLAPDAQAALVILRRDPAIDLLFTDILMPGGVDGSQLAESAVSLRPDLKVLVTSGYASATTLGALVRVTNGVFLRKPYRPRELVNRIRTMLAE